MLTTKKYEFRSVFKVIFTLKLLSTFIHSSATKATDSQSTDSDSDDELILLVEPEQFSMTEANLCAQTFYYILFDHSSSNKATADEEKNENEESISSRNTVDNQLQSLILANKNLISVDDVGNMLKNMLKFCLDEANSGERLSANLFY